MVATALCFGLVLLALAYTIGPISGLPHQPGRHYGLSRLGRMALIEAVGYWIAQFVGGIAGALVLWGIFSGSRIYSRTCRAWAPTASARCR